MAVEFVSLGECILNLQIEIDSSNRNIISQISWKVKFLNSIKIIPTASFPRRRDRNRFSVLGQWKGRLSLLALISFVFVAIGRCILLGPISKA